MSAVLRSQQFRAAAFAHDNACDCCGHEPDTSEREEALRHALASDPSFIGEAIGNGDLTNLVEGFKNVDPQHCWDAIHDLVQDHLKSQEKRMRVPPFQTADLRALERLCAAHGVSA